MAKKIKKISQKDAHMVLDMLGELIVSCRAWGMDLPGREFSPKDADTGEELPYGTKTILQKYGERVIALRQKIGQIK